MGIEVWKGKKETQFGMDQTEKSEKSDAGMKSIVGKFWEETSIPGINNSAKSSSWFGRGVWSLIFMAGLIATIIQSIGLALTYYSYPVSTSVLLINNRTVKFPAVTVCNHNRVHCQQLLDKVESCTVNTCPNFCVMVNMLKGGCKMDPTTPNNCSAPSSTSRKRRQAPPQKPPNTFNIENASPGMTAEYKFLKEYLNFDNLTRISLGHQKKSFILDCVFRGETCTDDMYFYVTTNPSYGNCFSFNFGGNIKQDPSAGDRTTAVTGPLYGLVLTLNLEQDNYMRNGETQSAAVRVNIHSPEQGHLIQEYGLDAMPNSATSISIQAMKISRQAAPYESFCFSDWSQSDYYLTTPYSTSHCQRLCLQESFIKACGCFHPLYLEDDSQKMGNPPCDMTPSEDEESNYYCITSQIQGFDNESLFCNCNPACEETVYNVQSSVSYWPAKQYERIVAAQYNFTGSTDSTTSRKKRQAGIAVPTTVKIANAATEGQTSQTTAGQANPTTDRQVSQTTAGQANPTTDRQANPTTVGPANPTTGGPANPTTGGQANPTTTVRTANPITVGQVNPTSAGKDSPTSAGQDSPTTAAQGGPSGAPTGGQGGPGGPPPPPLGENLVLLKIYFTSLNINKIEESPLYLISDGSLLGAIGGTISLYLGLSLTMLIEVVELVGNILFYKFKPSSKHH